MHTNFLAPFQSHPSLNMLIFLTDGHATKGVTDPSDIVSNIRMNVEHHTHIYTLGFGFDLDFDFLERLAILTGGTASRVMPDGDATTQLIEFYTVLNNPKLYNLQIVFPGDVVDTNSVQISSGTGSNGFTDPEFANMIYYEGSEIVTTGKLKAPTEQSWSIHVTANENSQEFSPFDDVTVVHPDSHSEVEMMEPNLPPGFTEKAWILSFIQEQYAASRVVENETLREEYRMSALSLALQYQLVTPLTSMLVIAPPEMSVSIEIETSDTSALQGHSTDAVLMSTIGRGNAQTPQVSYVSVTIVLCLRLFYT